MNRRREAVIAIDQVTERLLMAEKFGRAETIDFDDEEVYDRLQTLTRGRGPDRCILGMIEEGKVDPTFIVTHRRPLDEAPELYKTFRENEDGCVKVVLTP